MIEVIKFSIEKLREWFAKNSAVHIKLPDGWFGRPYDNLYCVDSICEENDRVIIRNIDDSMVITFDRNASILEKANAIVVSDFDQMTFLFINGDYRFFREYSDGNLMIGHWFD